MARDFSSSILIRLLQDNSGVSFSRLIDIVQAEGYDVEKALRTVRCMLDSGEIGLGREMDIQLLKQLA